MKIRLPQRRSPGRRASPPSVAVAVEVDMVRHARALHGDDADPWQVAGSLFQASFLSLAQLAPEDYARRHALLQRVLKWAHDALGERRSPGRSTSPPPVDVAADAVQHARTLHGDDADPWQVAGSLFRASFLSLGRLAPEDDARRHALLQWVLKRTMENGINRAEWTDYLTEVLKRLDALGRAASGNDASIARLVEDVQEPLGVLIGYLIPETAE